MTTPALTRQQKEVERRRRENINEGINMISALVPTGNDKQGKGTILRRAAEYMQELLEFKTSFEADRNTLQHELTNLRVRTVSLPVASPRADTYRLNSNTPLRAYKRRTRAQRDSK